MPLELGSPICEHLRIPCYSGVYSIIMAAHNLEVRHRSYKVDITVLLAEISIYLCT